MQQENAIEISNITKAFKVYLDRSDNIKDYVIHRNRRRYENRQVLKGISFDVKKGEAVGLIGRNGCGKSTTLKLLSRIMCPDSGEIFIRGRVSSLIELGAGFHPDMRKFFHCRSRNPTRRLPADLPVAPEARSDQPAYHTPETGRFLQAQHKSHPEGHQKCRS